MLDLPVDQFCRLLFIDETGQEAFADAAHPVFGYAGCAVLARDAPAVIKSPWRMVKEQHFGRADKPIHASDLGDLSSEQMEAIGSFFHSQEFGRFGVAMTKETQWT